MLAVAEGKTMFLLGETSFCRLGSVDLAALPATAHPRLRRLALHLGGSVCIVVAVESPVRRQENKARGHCG